MNNPPKDPNQLNKEKMSIKAPYVVWFFGFELSMTANTTMSIPQNTPIRPIIPPIPPMKNVKAAPMAAVAKPPIMTKMPPIRERTKAVVGFSLGKSCGYRWAPLLFNVDFHN